MRSKLPRVEGPQILGFLSRFLLMTVVVTVALAQKPDPRFMADFDSLAKTVKEHGAAVVSKKIDWDAVCATFKPRFAACTDDVTCVRLAMEMLATLRDSHTGITKSAIKNDALPSKWTGLFGGGLWLGWEQGRCVVRGVMKGHPIEASVPLGSVLLSIAGEPAWIALERERRRCAVFMGISSDHSFFASLGNRMLPFGDKSQLSCVFLGPDGKAKTVDVPRWGPGGKAFYPDEVFLPEGVAHAAGACSKILTGPAGMKLGYLKVTGSMDGATVTAFHAAFDALKGMDALLLDCRMMGGGSDDSAWQMCGRLFSAPRSNGNQRTLSPTGSWQFDGPAVMLQDESEVSSAETFTWALSETGRVISVGRTTGGWGIIPNGFELPSGLASYRLGVNDRGTSIRGIHTEGVGWPADVTVPLGPKVCAVADAPRAIGTAVLACLRTGAAVEETRKAFHALAEGDGAPLRTLSQKLGKKPGVDLEALAKLFADDLKAEIASEIAALKTDQTALPDVANCAKRLPRLAARAKAAGGAGTVADLESSMKALRNEQLAQDAWLALSDPFSPDAAVKKAFLAKHGGTKTGVFLREHLWK